MSPCPAMPRTAAEKWIDRLSSGEALQTLRVRSPAASPPTSVSGSTGAVRELEAFLTTTALQRTYQKTTHVQAVRTSPKSVGAGSTSSGGFEPTAPGSGNHARSVVLAWLEGQRASSPTNDSPSEGSCNDPQDPPRPQPGEPRVRFAKGPASQAPQAAPLPPAWPPGTSLTASVGRTQTSAAASTTGRLARARAAKAHRRPLGM